MSEEKKIFISQQVLDALFDQNQAELKGDELVILSKDKQIFKLIPAFKFLFLADGANDPHQMVGKIFTEEQLKSNQADIYMDSVIFKEVAYQVEPGFLGLPRIEKAAPPPEPAKVEPVEADKVDNMDDVNALANLLLKIM